MSGIEIVAKVLVLPEGMELGHGELHHFALSVEWRGRRSEGGRGGYAVSDGHQDLSRAGNWGFPEAFQQHQYRWENLEDALEMARKHVDTRKVHGRTWAEWKAAGISEL